MSNSENPNQHIKDVDYRVGEWPQLAQLEFGVKFWGQYIIRRLAADVRGKGEEFEEGDKNWANSIYEGIYNRLSAKTKQ